MEESAFVLLFSFTARSTWQNLTCVLSDHVRAIEKRVCR